MALALGWYVTPFSGLIKYTTKSVRTSDISRIDIAIIKLQLNQLYQALRINDADAETIFAEIKNKKEFNRVYVKIRP